MNNIIKISILSGVIAIAFGVFAFIPTVSNTVEDTVLAPIVALAWGDGDYGGGCCDGGGGGNNGGQDYDGWGSGDYGDGCCDYSEGGYYSQGNYYSEGGYYTQSYYQTTYTVAATCDSFTGSPTTLPYGGGNVTLTWNTTNATGVSINQGIGAVSADGSTVVNVTATKTFVLTATGTGGNDDCAVTITVAPQSVATCDSFTGSPTTLPYGGGNVTLTWATTNANSVSINNGVGVVSADGSKVVNVTTDTTFILTADGTNGDDDCQVTIDVQPPTSSAVCDSFTASPNSFTNGTGGQVTLTWNTTNANSVSINNGVGTVSADGSTSVNVTGNITYILTAVGTNGNDTCSAPVTVTTTNDNLTCDFLNASPNKISSAQNITLSWGTTGATSVSIDNGIGNVAQDGSISVYADNDRTYTLTLSNGSNTKTCQTSVDLDGGGGGGGGGGSSSPRCELEISDKKVKAGEKITLKWDTSRATKVEIEDDNGKEIFSTDEYSSSKKSDYYDGEIDVIVYEDTKFILEASKSSKKRTCKVEVEVEEDAIKVFEKRDQPLVISLREVPYTGFEAGPMLTALFYALLALWAAFIAYVVVLKKNPLDLFKPKATVLAHESDIALEYKKKVQNWGAMN
jgi:hypothetical protein